MYNLDSRKAPKYVPPLQERALVTNTVTADKASINQLDSPRSINCHPLAFPLIHPANANKTQKKPKKKKKKLTAIAHLQVRKLGNALPVKAVALEVDFRAAGNSVDSARPACGIKSTTFSFTPNWIST